MAAHVVLFFLLFCKGERSGISVAAGLSEEDQELQVTESKKQHVLHHPESINSFFVKVKDVERRDQGARGDVRVVSNLAFRLSGNITDDFDFKKNTEKQTDILKHPGSSAKSLIPKHSPELSLKLEESSNLTNGEVEGVINDRSLVPSSEEEHALQPKLSLETGVGDVQSERTRSKWVTESERSHSEPYLMSAVPRSRRRRSWLWNQFFVIEEYRGPEPVLIGRVSTCHKQSACTCELPESNSMKLYLCFIPAVRTRLVGMHMHLL